MFNNNNATTLVVGSSNLSKGGLFENEETSILIQDYGDNRIIKDFNNYFEDLWNGKSVSVKKYLELHPDYSVAQDKLEPGIDEKQKKVFDQLSNYLNSQSKRTFDFVKKVGKEIRNNGKVTIPQEYHKTLDDFNFCKLGESVDFDIVIQNDKKLIGKFYHSLNNTTSYYQFYIKHFRDKKVFKEFIGDSTHLEFTLNMANNMVEVRHEE